MKVAFEAAKDEINKEKHGLRLSEAVALFEDPEALILSSVRQDIDEKRYKIIGLYGGKLHTAIYTWRGETVRFISFRRASKNEQIGYAS